MSGGSKSGFALRPPAKLPEDLVDMTAMVDIVFFMLIFFMITSTQPVESTMDMPPPKQEGSAAASQASEQADHSDFIQVRIEDDDSIWVDEEQAFNESDLRVRLKQARDDGTHGEGVFVTGDADASHGAAVKVFDACADANLANVMFSVIDKDATP